MGLIPEGWHTKGVESAPLPSDSSVGSWMGFGLAQTGQLDKANSNTADAVSIIQKCEARNAAAFEALKPRPWWRIF